MTSVTKDAPQYNQILTRTETRLKDVNLATMHEKNKDYSLLSMHVDF